MEKIPYKTAKIKELLLDKAISKTLADKLAIPEIVIIKEISTRNSFDDKNQRTETVEKQVIKGLSGTSLLDAEEQEFDYVGTPLDEEAYLNQAVRLTDVSFGLVANMTKNSQGRNSFSGYSATGLKLIVSSLERIQEKG